MKRKDSGSMLVMALWGLTLLVLFSLSLGFGVRQKAALLSRLSALDAVYPIAYSGVEEAKSLVKSDSNFDVDLLGDPWASGTKRREIGGGAFSLQTDGLFPVVDEERKINLNNTSAEIAARLFERVTGLSKEDADELVYNLLDWMDSDSFFGHPQYGAEASYYENLKKPYTAKNAPYEVLDELLLVKGMTPALFEKVRPYVTVYGSGKVNINTAGREVLAALGFSTVGVETIVKYRSGQDGIDGTADDLFFASAGSIVGDIKTKGKAPLDQSQEVLLSGLLDGDRLGVASTAFSVTSRGELPNGATLEVDSVFNRKADVLYQRAREVRWPSLA